MDSMAEKEREREFRLRHREETHPAPTRSRSPGPARRERERESGVLSLVDTMEPPTTRRVIVAAGYEGDEAVSHRETGLTSG